MDEKKQVQPQQKAPDAIPTKKKKDPLVFSANIIGLALLLYVLISEAMRWGYKGIVLLISHFNASFSSPEWIVWLLNVLILMCSLIPAYFVLRKNGKKVHLKIGEGKGSLSFLVLLPLFLVFAILLNALEQGVANAFFPQANITSLGVQLPATAAGTVLYFIGVCVCSPLLEELFFRGAIQGLLRPWGGRFAVLWSALFFASFHSSPQKWITSFIMGVLLGIIAQAGGSIVPCIGLHYANNLYFFVLAIMQKHMRGDGAFALTAMLMVLLLSAAIWAVWKGMQTKQFAALRLPKDELKDKEKFYRTKRLATAPLFWVGCIAVAALAVERIILR